MDKRHELGRRGEDLAAGHLEVGTASTPGILWIAPCG